MVASCFRKLPVRIGLLPLLLSAYIGSTSVSQTITLDPPVTAPVEMLTINDLDFLNATTPKWLFTITMRANGSVRAVMEISINAMLADGTCCDGTPVRMTTDGFDIVNSRTITNIDLTRDNPKIDEYVVDDVAKTRLEQTGLPGGRIPTGLYTFTVIVTPEGGGPAAIATFTFEPMNPTSMELLFPADDEQDMNEFPLFQWRYDGPAARLSVYEKLPGQSTLEEVISGVPHMSEVTTTNSFQYPSSGARPLQPGKVYAWTVEGLAGVSGGSIAAIRSEIRSFRISTRNAAWVSTLLDEIEAALGDDYRSVFQRIRSEGLFTHGTMSLNGSPITYSELLPLLEQFRTNTESIGTVELE